MCSILEYTIDTPETVNSVFFSVSPFPRPWQFTVLKELPSSMYQLGFFQLQVTGAQLKLKTNKYTNKQTNQNIWLM